MHIIIDMNEPDQLTIAGDDLTSSPPHDLAVIATQLTERLAEHVPGSFLRGKTHMRNEVMDILSCSALRAEQIVDTLVARGHAEFKRSTRPAGDPRLGTWQLHGRRTS